MPNERHDAIDSKPRILVVEDGPAEREALARVLCLEGYDVELARDAVTALRYVGESIDLVISDLRMGRQSGIDLMRAWCEQRPDSLFIIVTAYGDIDSAVSAMKLGARDYITKPMDPSRLLGIVKSCLEQRAAEMPRSPSGDNVNADQLLGESQAIRHVREQVVRAAAADSTVLIFGESGTGKELIARAIHQHSRRKEAPLVTINMAAIPELRVESELFGHVQGAFAGATTQRIGRFLSANGGTLFVDEIGEFPKNCQAKLLHVLEAHTVQPFGGDSELPIDVRLIAATRRDIRKMAHEGTFRSDLLYRLNIVTIEVPPLRKRLEDVPILTDHFLRNIALKLGKPVPELSSGLVAFLCNYEWPGNVRELRNCLESMLVLSYDAHLTVDNLPAGFHPSSSEIERSTADDESRLDSLEKSVILHTLKLFDGNRTRAAMELGISVRTLQRRLKAWGMTPFEL